MATLSCLKRLRGTDNSTRNITVQTTGWRTVSPTTNTLPKTLLGWLLCLIKVSQFSQVPPPQENLSDLLGMAAKGWCGPCRAAEQLLVSWVTAKANEANEPPVKPPRPLREPREWVVGLCPFTGYIGHLDHTSCYNVPCSDCCLMANSSQQPGSSPRLNSAACSVHSIEKSSPRPYPF